LEIVNAVTIPPLIVAVATAPDPPPPVKLRVGATVYPDPPSFIVIEVTLPVLGPVPRTAVPIAAWIPPEVKFT
jgi:hypothetical protein